MGSCGNAKFAVGRFAIEMKMPTRSASLDLPVVHTMWLGTRLSRLELLTLCSLVKAGHSVKLWAYDVIRTPIPRGVELADAEKVFPRFKVKPKKEDEPEIGIGAGSVGGVFSDLFRYRVLYDFGGIWADMDVTALKPLSFPHEYAFRPHQYGMVGSIMKCPRHSPFLAAVYNATEPVASEHTPWLLPIRVLNTCVREAGLTSYVIPEMSNRDKWNDVSMLILGRQELPEQWYAIHWMNERWRTILRNQNQGIGPTPRIPSKDNPLVDTTLHDLYRLYGLCEGDPEV